MTDLALAIIGICGGGLVWWAGQGPLDPPLPSRQDAPYAVQVGPAILSYTGRFDAAPGNLAALQVHLRHRAHLRHTSTVGLNTFAQLFHHYGKQYNVDPYLLAAVAEHETGYNPAAVGPAGEIGIMQVMPKLRNGKITRFGEEWKRQEFHTVSLANHMKRLEFPKACLKQSDMCQRVVVKHGARLLSAALARCETVAAALGRYNQGSCWEGEYAQRVLKRIP